MTDLPPMAVDNRDKVLVGDCIELMRGLPAGSVDLITVLASAVSGMNNNKNDAAPAKEPLKP